MKLRTIKNAVTKEMVINDVYRLYNDVAPKYPSMEHYYKDDNYPHITVKYIKKFFGTVTKMQIELNLLGYRNAYIEVECSNCGNMVNKQYNMVKGKKNKTDRFFCNSSCATTYNNTHKTTGTRVSKLELYLQQVLPEMFKELEFKFNSKEEINSELDIYIPSLKLAFELNGIFHYEPVYGQDKLDKIINNDKLKFKACHEAGISLCVIDTTSQKKFTAESSSVFVALIEQIIMEVLEVVETSSVPSQGTILSS